MSSLGYKHTPEAKRRIGEAARSRVVSDDTRQRMSLANKGNPKRLGRAPWNKGVPASAEQRLKLSIAHRGKRQSPESVERRAAKVRGPNNRLWKGDNAHYTTIHKWLTKTFGKPSYCDNTHCIGDSGTYNWALRRGFSYQRNRDNYVWLCRSCHSLYDMKVNADMVVLSAMSPNYQRS